MNINIISGRSSIKCNHLFLFSIFIFVTNVAFAQDLQLIKATSQRWVAGVRGAGGGTYYELTLVVKKNSKQMNLDRLWLGDKNIDIHYLVKHKPPGTPKEMINNFNKNDTLIIKFSQYEPGERIPEDNPSKVMSPAIALATYPPPFQYKGVALISYRSKCRRKKTFEIEKFETLPVLHYP